MIRTSCEAPELLLGRQKAIGGAIMQSQLPFLQLSADREWVELYLYRDWLELSLKIRTSRLVVILLLLVGVIVGWIAGRPDLLIEWWRRALQA